MPRTYYPLGHPKHKPQKTRHATAKLADGSPNPLHKIQKAKLADGSPNPLYRPDTRKGDRHLDKAYHAHRNGSRSGKSLTKFNRAFFVGVDGEGVLPDSWIPSKENEATPQNYVLMCNSEGDELFNAEGINTVEGLNVLGQWATKYHLANLVVYGASYDINQLIKDIPKETLQELWKPELDEHGKDIKTRWEANERTVYYLEYRPHKSLWVGKVKRQYNTKTGKWVDVWEEKKHLNKPSSYERCYEFTFTLWDVLGFFQGSFVSAVEEYLGDDYPLLPIIREGKVQRQEFTANDIDFIKPYCQAEVKALKDLMGKLSEHLHSANLPIKRYDGAGAIAASLLERENVKSHMQKELVFILKHGNENDKHSYEQSELKHAIKCAYAGGHVELFKYGHHKGRGYNYDQISSYPSAMPELPSLVGGKWELAENTVDIINGKYQVTEYANNGHREPFSISYVEYDFEPGTPFYPFFYREKSGGIIFPSNGAGYYYEPEVKAALKALEQGIIKGNIVIWQTFNFYPATDIKPFGFVPSEFAKRAQWKKKETYNPAQKVIKLALNSLYGKEAQSIGGTKDNPPPFHCLQWAGYITSYCRAKQLEAMCLDPSAIIMSVTDGIYSIRPLPLPLGKNLGDWEESEHQIVDIVTVQAGVYFTTAKWDTEPTEKDRQQPRFNELWYEENGQWYKIFEKYRGLDKGSFTRSLALDAWKKDKAHDNKLVVEATSNRFITLGSALSNDGNPFWCMWRHWRKAKKDVAMYPRDMQGKRKLIDTWKKRHPEHELVETLPVYNLEWNEHKEPSHEFRLGWERKEGEFGKIDSVPHSIHDAEHYASEV